jgi:hypothetical protein
MAVLLEEDLIVGVERSWSREMCSFPRPVLKATAALCLESDPVGMDLSVLGDRLAVDPTSPGRVECRCQIYIEHQTHTAWTFVTYSDFR